jgi:hypothetical protein
MSNFFDLSKEQRQDIVETATKITNFTQAFKMAWWNKEDRPNIKESALDDLALIAYNLLIK